ncbi:amidohydrolase family protein [Ohessyouella blattaphilus]|uniref:Amidohydrolase family protein n=1 Tax=Ohessyouella blattaphilus TaxID=2949333 RepID=A0ABT1EKC3_9FIRM|nr:amidohydrolase family protein [Ohessyouella blattaphilus]MCP1111140.1 amidohydrolase family protein [Ohessyouella blattaphilus]MCR8564534.1 amidohydrolase family protein [Ohessyouella blattaphilus]
MKEEVKVLKGDICYSDKDRKLITVADGYLVYQGNQILGVYEALPIEYQGVPISDYTNKLIIPGLTDLHVHAPQYGFRGLQMDLELLEWLNTTTFVEEAKYQDLEYAKKAYTQFVNDLQKGGTTRACIFGTIHSEATKMLMELLDESGLVAYVGKVNMTRNSPDNLRETAEQSLRDTKQWVQEVGDKYTHVKPILTPRFIPSCDEETLHGLKAIQEEYKLPVQSHLSENRDEIRWVKELVPASTCYGDAYARTGLFGDEVPTIMAHCVYSTEEEIEMMKDRGVYVAHCPQSNTNLSSGIAPARLYLDKELKIGLGTDVAGGANLSIFRAMTDGIQVSKLYKVYVQPDQKPLTMEEAFYLGTYGGGSFFGKVGSFLPGFEMDALVLDESDIPHPQELTVKERLERFLYLSGDPGVKHKYVAGKQIR